MLPATLPVMLLLLLLLLPLLPLLVLRGGVEFIADHGEVGVGVCVGAGSASSWTRRLFSAAFTSAGWEGTLRGSVDWVTFFAPDIGRDNPLSFPLLATPMPQVNVVLYPEHCRPMSRHGVQYGRRLSHRTCLLAQVKQSSAAPLPTARRRRFRGTTDEPSPFVLGLRAFVVPGVAVMA